jgi:DNA-binding response OmpR family regulator
LRLKEIIVGEPAALFSPLFTEYVLVHSKIDVVGILVDTHLRQVWVDGQLLTKKLAPLEFGLLEHLARHAGTVCKREDILRELYKEKESEANDERLDTILRRLREALHDDAHHPRHLITHRGIGVQLARGHIQE